MPLLRITCPADRTDTIVGVLQQNARARDVSVIPGASRTSGGDLILADVPRSTIDEIIERLDGQHPEGLHIAVEASAPLYPRTDEVVADDDAVIWAQVSEDLHDLGRLSWINTLLVVVASAIAAMGIIQDQLLLIVGAMALSPDYFPIADTCLAVVLRDRHRVRAGLVTIVAIFSAGIVGAWALTELLVRAGLVSAETAPSQQLTLFISQPDSLSVVVALLAGIAGALAVTLPDARGLVGVFVSITTIPAAANIGVAFVAREWSPMSGAAVQLAVNVTSLLVAGVITLGLRRRIHLRFGASRSGGGFG